MIYTREYWRAQYRKHREKVIERSKKYYFRNRSKILSRLKNLSQTEKDELNTKRRNRYLLTFPHKRVRSRESEKSKLNRVQLKLEIMTFYGGKCECCQEKNISFLSIDHKNNNAKDDIPNSKRRLKGINLYWWLKKNNFPNHVRILCFNCNIGRQNNKGICPHKI